MKKWITLLLAIILSLPLCACSVDKSDSDGNNTDGYYPVTVTDHAGRTVEITKQPERLLSSYYITTSLFIALDIDDKLVGVETQADKRPIYGMAAPHLLQLPSIGTAKELDLELCASLSPDLAVLPMKLKGMEDALEDLKIPVLFVDPENRERQANMISLVGDAVNCKDEAKRLNDFMTKQAQMLEDLMKDTTAPTVYLAGNSDFLSTAGNAMYQADMIAFAGGINVAGGLTDTYWAQIDYEQFLVWDPEYIILASDASYTVEDVYNDPNLASCTAVTNGNVYRLPNDAEPWDSPVPSGILGSLWLANILHPDKLSDVDYRSLIDEFYETFYGFTYSEK